MLETLGLSSWALVLIQVFDYLAHCNMNSTSSRAIFAYCRVSNSVVCYFLSMLSHFPTLWRNWELRWHATLGRRREKLSPICGAEWASCCSAAILGDRIPHQSGAISMGLYNSTIHCLLTMINVWKPWITHTYTMLSLSTSEWKCLKDQQIYFSFVLTKCVTVFVC